MNKSANSIKSEQENSQRKPIKTHPMKAVAVCDTRVILDPGLSGRKDFNEATRYKTCHNVTPHKGHDEDTDQAETSFEKSDLKYFLESIGYDTLDTGKRAESHQLNELIEKSLNDKDLGMVFAAFDRQGLLIKTALDKGLPFIYVAPDNCHAWGFDLNGNIFQETKGSVRCEEVTKVHCSEWVQCCKNEMCQLHERYYHPSDSMELADRADNYQDILRRRHGGIILSVPVFQLSSALDILRWQTFHRFHESYCTHKLVAASSSINRASRQTAEIIEVIMGNKFQAGQVGAQGINPHAHDMTFNQIWDQKSADIDLEILARQLNMLSNELMKSAQTAEDQVEIGTIANAEIKAQEGNGPKALSALSKVGKWSLNTAEKIGVGVAIAAIKSACNI